MSKSPLMMILYLAHISYFRAISKQPGLSEMSNQNKEHNFCTLFTTVPTNFVHRLQQCPPFSWDSRRMLDFPHGESWWYGVWSLHSNTTTRSKDGGKRPYNTPASLPILPGLRRFPKWELIMFYLEFETLDKFISIANIKKRAKFHSAVRIGRLDAMYSVAEQVADMRVFETVLEWNVKYRSSFPINTCLFVFSVRFNGASYQLCRFYGARCQLYR